MSYVSINLSFENVNVELQHFSMKIKLKNKLHLKKHL